MKRKTSYLSIFIILALTPILSLNVRGGKNDQPPQEASEGGIQIDRNWRLTRVSDLKDGGSLLFTFTQADKTFNILAVHRKKGRDQEIITFTDDDEPTEYKTIAPNSKSEDDLLRFLHGACMHDITIARTPLVNWLNLVIPSREKPWP